MALTIRIRSSRRLRQHRSLLQHRPQPDLRASILVGANAWTFCILPNRHRHLTIFSHMSVELLLGAHSHLLRQTTRFSDRMFLALCMLHLGCYCEVL